MGLNLAAILDPHDAAIVPDCRHHPAVSRHDHHVYPEFAPVVLLGFERTYAVLPIGGAHLNNALFENVVVADQPDFHTRVANLRAHHCRLLCHHPGLCRA